MKADFEERALSGLIDVIAFVVLLVCIGFILNFIFGLLNPPNPKGGAAASVGMVYLPATEFTAEGVNGLLSSVMSLSLSSSLMATGHYLYTVPELTAEGANVLLSSVMTLFFTPFLMATGEMIYFISPGKKITGLKIMSNNKSNPSYPQRLLRCFLKYIAFVYLDCEITYLIFGVGSSFGNGDGIFIIFGGLLILTFISWFFCFRKSRLALYDQLSGTAVYRTRK